jgi:hypothetical protein
LTRGSSSEVVLGGGFLGGGGGGGGGGGSLSEYLYERWGGLKRKKIVSQSPTRKIGDPLYTTFQKIFTIIRIFLKSEAPKAPGLFTFVHRGGLD